MRWLYFPGLIDRNLSSKFDLPYPQPCLGAGFSLAARLWLAKEPRRAMKLNLRKKKNPTYLYLVPQTDGLAKWELLDQAELERRAAQNELAEDGRVFEVDKERLIRTEKTTFLE